MNVENIREKDDRAPDHIIKGIAEEMRVLPFVSAVVLGGSHATGTAGAGSDIDIGIYYRADDIDYTAMNAAAARLDDGHRENLICRSGEWGKLGKLRRMACCGRQRSRPYHEGSRQGCKSH